MDEHNVKTARITGLLSKRDYLRQQLASLDKEYADEISPLQGGLVELGADAIARKHRGMCTHSCADHAALMDPAIWGNLPEEILQMVFARLPLRQIVSLQCLCKAWRWNVAARESGFRRLCANVAALKPNLMFALADEPLEEETGFVSIKLFDGEAQQWHVFDMALQPQFDGDTMLACDGGLVCYVSRAVASPLLIAVLNPLTREYKVLPVPQGTALNEGHPQMVQLIMDRETESYKVLVVGKRRRRSRTVPAEVYSSSTGTWSSADSMPHALVFGYHFRWTRTDGDYDQCRMVGPCAYVCGEARLLNLADRLLGSCKGYALLKDRLFVLHQEIREQRYGGDHGLIVIVARLVLSEYQGRRTAPHWVKVRDHECTPLRPQGIRPLAESSFQMILHACGDSLIVTVTNNDFGAFEVLRIFLYDLSRCQWQEIPAVPGVEPDDQPCSQNALCELRWDAAP